MQFIYKNSSLLSENKIKETAQSIWPYIKSLKKIKPNNYEASESSINLPSDKSILNQIKAVVQKIDIKGLKYVVVLGLGGSNLGAKAIYDSLLGYKDLFESNYFPKLLFCDTNDPEYTSKLVEFLKKNIKKSSELIINYISKSGSTTEASANFEIFVDNLKSKLKDVSSRVIITTDQDSKLWNMAKEKNIPTLSIPKTVGGRYSIFSAVGLLPLLLGNVNIQALLDGAQDVISACLSENPLENPALISASILYLQAKEGKNINDNFFFHLEHESLGKWYRQLMGESIGKDGKGITPTVSIGSTDLHSVAQLYFGGPRDKITTFIWSKKSANDLTVPNKLLFPIITNIQNKKLSEIMSAIREGVKISYLNQKMPYTEIVLDDLSEKSLGQFMQFKMIEIMYLAKLLQVNAFDQPHVELYKIETKKLLNG